ncbi:DUF3035 domain-containing protein [Roseovarius sp.]
MILPRCTVMIVTLGLLTACGNRGEDVTLTRITNTGDGPDEFSILPSKPLQTPESYTALPAPTPGTRNLTDQDPKADGVAALGGNPAALAVTTPAASDAGLLRYASRNGTQPAIREALAAEDADIRRSYGRVNILRIGPRDNYADAYKDQWLDSHAEEERLRRSGIDTPSAPPKED